MPEVLEGHTASSTPRRMEVLVVDDIATLADALVLLLNSEGLNATAVYSGQDALAACSSYLPDLVLLDFAMPEMDGVEVAERLGRLPISRRPKIVIHTAFDLSSPRLRDARCDKLLRKTYRTEELAEVLQQVMDAPRAEW